MGTRLGEGESARVTRAEALRRAAVLAAPAVIGAPLLRAPQARAASQPTTFGISAAELAQIKANVFDLRLGFAVRAWTKTKSKADELMGYEPSPTRPDANVADWFNVVYHPGLLDGEAAYTLATAYAIGRRPEHAERAKNICLAWARTYYPAPSPIKIGHMVAEPVGPVIKLCMAYDLVKGTFSSSDRADFERWAAQFVKRGRDSADSARDFPWAGEVSYGGETTLWAPYGNSATWQRAMAVWAAAVIGSATLRDTLEWSFSHRTGKGIEYGWDDLLEGLVLDGAGGQVTEDRYRQSIHYGFFSWAPLVLIADIARHARFRVDLFNYKTHRNGYSVFTPVSYYAPFLMSESVPAALERTTYGGSQWPEDASRWRALFEILYRNASDPPVVKILRKVVNYGGPTRRGDNYNIYFAGRTALFGRGPKGPMPAPAKAPKPKS